MDEPTPALAGSGSDRRRTTPPGWRPAAPRAVRRACRWWRAFAASWHQGRTRDPRGGAPARRRTARGLGRHRRCWSPPTGLRRRTDRAVPRRCGPGWPARGLAPCGRAHRPRAIPPRRSGFMRDGSGGLRGGRAWPAPPRRGSRRRGRRASPAHRRELRRDRRSRPALTSGARSITAARAVGTTARGRRSPVCAAPSSDSVAFSSSAGAVGRSPAPAAPRGPWHGRRR